MYVDLITHSTLYAICHTNYPRLAPRRVHGIISRAKADPTWRSSVGANHAEVKTLSASCGPQIPLTWRNAYWGLWVEPTRSWKVISSFHPCQAFSYGHLGWNLIQLSTGHVSFPFPSILFLQKKTKMYNTNRRYSGEIMVTKISSTVYWTSRQWELWRETPWDLSLYFL